jgi:hypothetical protein
MSSRHRRSRDRVGRYYDPTTGQFLTVDPLVDFTGEPYAYGYDDPTDRADPSGNAAVWGDGAACSPTIAGSTSEAGVVNGLRLPNGGIGIGANDWVTSTSDGGQTLPWPGAGVEPESLRFWIALGLTAAVADFCYKTDACHLGESTPGLTLYRKGETNNSGLGLNALVPDPISFWDSLDNRAAWDSGSYQTGKRWFEIATALLPKTVVTIPTNPTDDVPSLNNKGHFSLFGLTEAQAVKDAVIGKGTFGPNPYGG